VLGHGIGLGLPTRLAASFADGDDSFAAGKLAALFKDGFDVLRDEVVETTPDWKRDRAKVEHFVARKR
jgi:hypothetical protein